MIASNFELNRLAFRAWPKGFSQDVFFKNYFSYFPKSLPVYYSYFHFSNSNNYTRFRLYCVRSRSYGYVSAQSIEAFRKVLAPSFRKRTYYNSKFNIWIYPYLNLTKKPAEVRMGGGKGSKIRKSVSPVKPGQILFTITIFSPSRSIKLLKHASSKLGISVSVSPI